MIDISTVSILDIMPHNLRHDPQIQALAKALDKELDVPIYECLIKPRIDELPEPLCDHLLWESHITSDEGAVLASTVQEKRELIKKAFSLHKIKGTPAAIEQVLEVLSMRGIVEEWWQYSGDPYKFRISIDLFTRGVTEDRLILLERLVMNYKNTRSHLESINLHLSSRVKAYMGCSIAAGETITVYPWNNTEIVGRGVLRIAAGYQAIETTTLYPEEV